MFPVPLNSTCIADERVVPVKGPPFHWSVHTTADEPADVIAFYTRVLGRAADEDGCRWREPWPEWLRSVSVFAVAVKALIPPSARASIPSTARTLVMLIERDAATSTSDLHPAAEPGAGEPPKRKRRRWWLWFVPLGVLGLLVGVLSLRDGVYLPAHRHCIKQADFALSDYALENGGRYPTHPNGYGNALLLAVNELNGHCLTGPGYDPAAFRKAKDEGRSLTEEECGRVYVQGLTQTSGARIAILFDKLSTPGGDHCHWPVQLWATRGREVLMRNDHRFIPDSKWPAFAAGQIELLEKEGIPRAEAERLYAQVR